MNKLYIVFDQIPPINSGGLLVTYINLVDLLKDKYDVEIISVFDIRDTEKEIFHKNKIHILSKQNIDIRFYKAFQYLKMKQFKKFCHGIFSAFYYFISIPFIRSKMKKIIHEDDLVIVSCPSAGIFMSNKIKFILEIHIDYNYFFGNNLLGTLQAKMMAKPTMTLFRTKDNANCAPKYLNPSYIYNFFDNKGSKRNDKLIKNKILFVGRIEQQKNPLKLIDMAYKLSKVNKNFTLDIYGTGSMLDVVKQKIKDLKLEKVVFYKGFTKDKNIYNQYSLLWLTSDFEGFGLVIIEGKACGIPTVSTNWGNAVYEVIEDKKDGYVVNNDDDFINYTNKILTDSTLQKKLSDQAYKNFNKFSKDRAKKKWIKILESYKKD